MSAAVILLALIALAVVTAVAWPLVVGAPEPQIAEVDAEQQELQDEIDRSLSAIREIDQDHRAGNLSDEDFASLDAEERARAAELLRRRDGPAG